MKILIIDDDALIAGLISDSLEDEGFETVVISSGEEAITYIDRNYSEISLITLDIMMPGMDGYDVCRIIRGKISCPIIFITAMGKSVDTIKGLEAGADDYIAKPFEIETLVARIKAHLRRQERTFAKNSDFIRVGEIELSKESMTVTRSGKKVSISTREFQLLLFLMENVGKVLTREEIFDHIWNTEYGDIGTVAVNIKSLRTKLDPHNDYIKTVWGVGYKFVDDSIGSFTIS